FGSCMLGICGACHWAPASGARYGGTYGTYVVPASGGGVGATYGVIPPSVTIARADLPACSEFGSQPHSVKVTKRYPGNKRIVALRRSGIAYSAPQMLRGIGTTYDRCGVTPEMTPWGFPMGSGTDRCRPSRNAGFAGYDGDAGDVGV